jgi:hypothetical protein
VERLNRIVIATVVAVAAWLSACTRNPYVLGAICPDGGAPSDPRCSTTPSGVTFAVGLDQSGASRLGPSLALPSGAVPATLRLRGESAVAQAWPSDQGARLLVPGGAGAPRTQLPAPFTDGTRAAAPALGQATYVADSPALGEVGADDFVLELVFRAPSRASVIAKLGPVTGWSLETTGNVLSLTLRDTVQTAAVPTEPLNPIDPPLGRMSWTHCLFWVSRAEGGRADCNGRVGVLTALGGLGDLTSTGSLTVGGMADQGDSTQLAVFTLFRVAPGQLGPAAGWLDVGRRRFADLTGTRARNADGSALPKAGLRESPATVDMDLDPTQLRRLFLVGPDWPRIACRADAAGARDCGYLSEARRQRRVPAGPSGWAATGLTINLGRAVFAGDGLMDALIPSAAAGPHSLSFTGTFAGARQALSFFARAEQGKRIGATAGDRGLAIFDLGAGTVVTAPAGVDASIESWRGGLFRCAYVFAPPAGPLTYGVHLLDDAGNQAFAGDGTTAWVDLAGLQLDVGQAYAGTLLAADDQAADTLTFVGNDGNFPPGATGGVSLRVLLPPGPRLTDQAIVNFNRGGTFEDQIQLYVRGDTAQLEFYGLRGGATDWTLVSAGALTDGLRHMLGARWAVTTASLQVGTVQIVQPSLITDATPFAFDRIDVGFSNSSGHLEGLIAGLQIGH